MPIEAIKNWCNRFIFRSKAKPLEILREQGLKWAVPLTFPPSFCSVLIQSY